MRTFSQAVVAAVSLDALMAEAGGTVADVVADPTINVKAEALLVIANRKLVLPQFW